MKTPPVFTQSFCADSPLLVESHPRPYRHRVQSLLYVTLNRSNGGVVSNLSEGGMAVQSVGHLQTGEILPVSCRLAGPAQRIDLTAEVMWTERNGRAGLRFLDASPEQTNLLKRWILDELLASAESMVAAGLAMPGDFKEAASLPDQAAIPASVEPVDLNWWAMPISLSVLSRLLDGMIVSAAVLLFCLLAIGIMRGPQAGSLTLTYLISVVAFLGGLYWWIFVGQGCATPGQTLARMAMEEARSRAADGLEAQNPVPATVG